MQPVRQDGPDVLVHVFVVPNASTNEIMGRHGDRIRIRVASPADRGRANAAVCDLIRTATGATSVEVVGGATSRSKRVRVFGAKQSDVSRSMVREA